MLRGNLQGPQPPQAPRQDGAGTEHRGDPMNSARYASPVMPAAWSVSLVGGDPDRPRPWSPSRVCGFGSHPDCRHGTPSVWRSEPRDSKQRRGDAGLATPILRISGHPLTRRSAAPHHCCRLGRRHSRRMGSTRTSAATGHLQAARRARPSRAARTRTPRCRPLRRPASRPACRGRGRPGLRCGPARVARRARQ